MEAVVHSPKTLDSIGEAADLDIALTADPKGEITKLEVISAANLEAGVVPPPQPKPKGDWKMTIEEFSFAGCHYNSSCD